MPKFGPNKWCIKFKKWQKSVEKGKKGQVKGRHWAKKSVEILTKNKAQMQKIA